MRSAKFVETTTTLALVLLLISPALTVPVSAGIQPIELFRGGSSNAGLPALYVTDQQQEPQGAKIVALDSAGADALEGTPSASLSSAGIMISQEMRSVLPLVSGGSGELVLFLQQNGQTLVIIRASGEGSEMPSMQVSMRLPSAWSDTSKRRSRFAIVVQILDVLKEGPMTPYELGFRLRLNDKRAKSYLDMLEKKELVESTIKEGRTSYMLTVAGKDFVRRLKTAFELRGKPPIQDIRDIFSDLL